MNLLSKLAPAPPDILMQAGRAFVLDQRVDKINLGVGTYYDDDGRVPVLRAVREAERRLETDRRPWPYLQAEGLTSLREGVLRLALGDNLAAEIGDRISVQQTVGGTGAVRLGAEIVAALDPEASVAVSNPSWPNHETIFRAVRLRVRRYSYHDPSTGGLDAAGMLRDLDSLPEGTVVVLHACCHNPTGVDPTEQEWRDVIDTIQRRRLVPFVDLAYIGFGAGLEVDAHLVRALAAAVTPTFLALSFSKSFSLYGERVGALCTIASDRREASLLGELARRTARALYSSPPTHGGALVSAVLADSSLTGLWVEELDAMRLRVDAMRSGFVERLSYGNAPRDFSFIAAQRGLFSYSGLTVKQIGRLREEHAIHAIDDGRLCLSALNSGNIDRVSAAIRQVVM